jgi:pyruvate,water dikinase
LLALVELSSRQAAGFRVPEFVVSPADIRAAVDRLGTPLAVRSSASAEDGADVSFAGQFRSFLNLNTLEDVEQAVLLCRESLSEPSVIEYCRKSGIDPQSIRMEVIIQRMIEPELAGVAFTVNPVTGAEQVVIEACAGLADELLAGREQPLPPEHPLLQQYCTEIERTARQIQRHFGAPQDIEFAVQAGTLYILQSRPITRITFAANVGEWTNADFRDGGVSSSVCTPLMWSLYDFVWDRTLKDCLRELRLFEKDFPAGRMFFGRPYWNLGAVKDCLAKLPGFVEREFDEDLSVQINYKGDGRCTPFTPRRMLRAIPTLLGMRKFFRRQQAFVERFLAGGFDAFVQKYEPMPDADETTFRDLIERDYFHVESNYFRTIFAASLAKLDFLSSFPAADYGSLVAALPPLRHMAPIRAVQAMSNRTDERLAEVVSTYRHHCRLGLDVLFPRWNEDRPFVRQMLASLPASGGADPRPAYEAARMAALSRLPWWKHRTFNRKLDRLRRFVWLREEMRDLSSRMYYLIRRYVLEIAQRRGLGDDIFFTTFHEIFTDNRSNIQRNREIYDSYRHFKAPNEIGTRYRLDRRPRTDGLTGIGASPGSIAGTAHIAHSVEQAAEMQTGQILVCPFTDPGWTPVLDRAAGVVTETGGLLSHAAIICREYGIPAVLGVENATSRIGHGSRIVIHGGEGRVEFTSIE